MFKAKRKRRVGGVSERTLRRRKAEGLTSPNEENESSSADSISSIDDGAVEYLTSIERLFQKDRDSSPQRDSPRSLTQGGDSCVSPSGSPLSSILSVESIEVPAESDDSLTDEPPDCDTELIDEWYDEVFSGTLVFDCESCIDCSCIVCEECQHLDSGDCVHCDRCKSYKCVSEDDSFYDCDEEVLSPEAARNKSIKDDFTGIVNKHLLQHSVVDDLLVFFRKWTFGNFPKSAKTLLKTPLVTPVREVPPGEYWHRGITVDVIEFVRKTQCDTVKVCVGCDGVPLATSSNSSFYPILCSFNNSSEVILAGAYHGYSKPKDSNIYLKDFCEEMTCLCTDGLVVDGKSISVQFHCLLCDAPAKAMVLLIKNFNGYFSCPKCSQEGEMDMRRMCFPEVDAPLRTDNTFRAHEQKENHVGKADIHDIPTFGPVSCVPYDYMHLVLLGVMRKIMYMWLQGPLKVRLKARLAAMISDTLVSLMSWKPREFARRLRQLQFIKRFKATEFRQILFYLGPVVFEGVLPSNLYEHFVVLHVAMTILAHPQFSQTHVDYAEELLKFWVTTFKSLYGSAHVSHNVHGLIHLAADVRKFGPLDDFSAFKFENFMHFLIKLVRKGERPLQQLARRYGELSSFTKEQNASPLAGTFAKRHVDGPLLPNCANPQFSKFQMSGNVQLDIASESNNCCVMSDGSIVLVKNFAFSNISKEIKVIGRKLLCVQDLYSYPIPSSTLGIYYVSNLSPLMSWPRECVSNKLYRMPFKAGFAVVPLLHTDCN